MTLNRYAPAAPQNFVAGKTGTTSVNAEWTANRERDVVGYKVYRQQAGGSVRR